MLSAGSVLAQEGSEPTKFVAANETLTGRSCCESEAEHRDLAVARDSNVRAINAVSAASGAANEISYALGLRDFRAPSRLLVGSFRQLDGRRWQRRGLLPHMLSTPGRLPWTEHGCARPSSTAEFGAAVINVNTPGELESARRKWWQDYVPSPTVIGPCDFYVAGMMHLADVWRGSTFGGTYKGEFTLASGQHESVDMMPSELSNYSHARTDSFEAIELHCWSRYLLVIVPKPGMDIFQLEDALANDPQVVDRSLKSEPGDVELPRMQFQFQTDFAPSLQRMGVRQVFRNLDFVNIP